MRGEEEEGRSARAEAADGSHWTEDCRASPVTVSVLVSVALFAFSSLNGSHCSTSVPSLPSLCSACAHSITPSSHPCSPHFNLPSSSASYGNYLLPSDIPSVSSFDDLLRSLRADDDLRAAHHQQQQQQSLLFQQRLQSFHAHYADVAQRNDALSSDWQTLASVHQTLQGEYRTLKAAKERLQMELEEAKREADDERHAAADEAQLQRQRLEHFQAQVERLAAVGREQAEEVVAYQQERESFLQQVQDVSSQLADEQREHQSLQSLLHDVEGQLSRSLHEATELRARVRSVEADAQAMRNANFVAQKELEKHEGLAAMIQHLSDEAKKVLTVKSSKQPSMPPTPATDAIKQQRITGRERRPLEEIEPNTAG